MNRICCSAPGKLFLGGEYAVLSGAEAIVTAVDRRVTAWPIKGKGATSPILTAVRQHVTDFLFEGGITDFTPGPLETKSRDFQIGGRKIGLGSSAAVSAAATGALFEQAGLTIGKNRDKILKVATSAHREAQGGTGSGADVAAAVHGGTIIFAMGGQLETVDTQSVELIPVWSGKPASTTELVKRVDAFSRSDPSAHRACFDQLRAAAADLAEAYRSGNAALMISATKVYGEQMAELGRASGANIVTKAHAIIANIADALGGAAKPSGAGGGDAAVALFEDPAASKAFRKQCMRYELTPLDIKTGAPGLMRDEG